MTTDLESVYITHRFKAKVYYLERLDLYLTEKPYMITFDPPGIDVVKTNHQYSEHEVIMSDVRGNIKDFDIEKQGFQFRNWPTVLQPKDFADEKIVTAKYYDEIRAKMHEAFPNVLDIHVMTHLLRRRPDTSQDNRNETYGPIQYAHGDFSPEGASASLEPFLQQNAHLRGKRLEIINVWRVIKGPNRDWPLAVCDHSSVSLEHDIEYNDVIHPTHVGESVRAYYSPAHRWYFLGEQTVDEVIIFRNCDSRGMQVPFALHLAFSDPRETDALPPRESIETRMACFF